jgi:hypothetical protein
MTAVLSKCPRCDIDVDRVGARAIGAICTGNSPQIPSPPVRAGEAFGRVDGRIDHTSSRAIVMHEPPDQVTGM